MADNKWTSKQLSAIETRGRRLLVSAAAGSGKTAVLVERIIRRILDPVEPVSVDRLLVVTFTKAAAAQMKDRIRNRLTEAVDDPATDAEVRLYLKEQLAMLDGASIQTIDSFCMNVVRDHTDELDIDPNVRVAEDAELTLIKADVMEEMLESHYEEAKEDFIDFAEAFGQGTSGAGLDEKILEVYGFAQVTENPEEWYEEQLNDENSVKLTDYIFENVKTLVVSCMPALEKLHERCVCGDGPRSYAAALSSDIEFIENVEGTGSYAEFCDVMRSYSWPAIGRKSKTDNEFTAEKIKAVREGIKKNVKAWTADFTRQSAEEAREEQALTKPHLSVIISLAREFDHGFSAAKRERNVIDFGDLEHMALKVLENNPDFKCRFDEIYVDEYQDTNDIQEALVRALDDGRVFMVGDVKQSIYKFRQAKPEIFMDKYERFARLPESTEGGDAVIELSSNFRSRPEVLDSVNRLFRKLMVKKLGGVEYTREAELYPGASFGELTKDAGGWNYETEMLIANVGDIDSEDSSHAAEARMIARKIEELTDPDAGMLIWDGDGQEYRRARYSDIVILLRSANSSGDVYLNTLLNAGIQAYCETNRGYFDSLEVRTMLAMLTAIDNPRREIEFASFLHSPIIGLSDDELVVLTKARERLEGTGKFKYERAMEMLARYRRMSRYLDIPELITKIYDETGYYEYASTLPAGKVRKANLDKLRDMAAEYAGTGYRGLFNFLRYIDNLKTYDTDFGEASALNEHDDLVRIMSIHKSKGLEFPIVFLANAEKKINQKDSNQPVLVDDELGVGCTYINTSERYRRKTLKQMALRLKLRNDTLGEELRVLYVAMTRAKEKLYITGTVKDADKFIEQYEGAPRDDAPLAMSRLRSDNGYLYWMLESGVRYPYDIQDPGDEFSRRELVSAEKIKKHLSGMIVESARRDEYERIFNFEYPHAADVDLRNKISISELKKRWALENVGETEEIEYNYFGQIKDDLSITGSERGIMYHEFLEKFDYASPDLSNLPECVDKKDIETFLGSELGKRFAKAHSEGRLYRERQFIMGVPAKDLKLAQSCENVLVQGIIDAYIEEDDGIILVDYKTDKVTDKQKLIDRYSGQLHYYAMALEKMKGKKVKEKIIWSFALGRAIVLE